MALDFDGILCQDCQPWQDDDGDNYVQWMKTATPLYVPRRTEVPLIVTARLNKYRAITQAWLDRHKFVSSASSCIGETLRDRNRDDIAAYKARHFMSGRSDLKTEASVPSCSLKATITRLVALAKFQNAVRLPAHRECLLMMDRHTAVTNATRSRVRHGRPSYAGCSTRFAAANRMRRSAHIVAGLSLSVSLACQTLRLSTSTMDRCGSATTGLVRYSMPRLSDSGRQASSSPDDSIVLRLQLSRIAGFCLH